MRLLVAGAVLMATGALSLGATPSAKATEQRGGQPERPATFTPPIGTNHGSVVANPMAKTPNGIEMDIIWW